jgi:hypothetical protein
MDRPFRCYELLLPLRFNDGTPVPDELIAETWLELEQRFGSVSCETQQISGMWTHEGANYRDELVRAFVDVPDTEENRQFFESLKERLKVRFQQLEIYIRTYPLEIL